MKSKSTKKNLDLWNDYHYEKKNPIQLKLAIHVSYISTIQTIKIIHD